LGKDANVSGGVEHDESSSQTKLHARGREGILLGAWGKDTDALVSLQRQALASLLAGGAAGWDALLALSLTKTRFAGRDSIKSDKKKDVMIKVLKEVTEDNLCESLEGERDFLFSCRNQCRFPCGNQCLAIDVAISEILQNKICFFSEHPKCESVHHPKRRDRCGHFRNFTKQDLLCF
jgi:hypothetical protein